jgi:hypothetical protein
MCLEGGDKKRFLRFLLLNSVEQHALAKEGTSRHECSTQLYKLAGRAESHAGLFTFAGNIGDGRHADPLELRLADNVALY